MRKSLRDELVEELYPFMDGDYNADEWAEQALDAVLDRLFKRRLRWFMTAQPLAKTDERYDLLYAGIDALRKSA